MSEMKQRFLKAMQYLYPNTAVPDQQLVDLARAFSMGWGECLMEQAERLARSDDARAWFEQTKSMASDDWIPDDSWKWWKSIPESN